MQEEWVTISEATIILWSGGIHISPGLLPRLAAQGRIRTLNDPIDKRVRLVEINEVRSLCLSSPSAMQKTPNHIVTKPGEVEYRYTVYRLIDPRDSTTRYVGKTARTLKDRLQGHQADQSTNQEKRDWLQELKAADIEPVIEPIESDLKPEQAEEREKYWIQYYLRTGAPLTNLRGREKKSDNEFR